MKKSTIILLTILALGLLSSLCDGQPPAKKVKPKTADTTNIIYQLPGDQNIQLLYNLLQAGYTGVSSSPHFSKDQADAYKSGSMHLDSIFSPQIKMFHPKKP
jgi:hypothetical protein